MPRDCCSGRDKPVSIRRWLVTVLGFLLAVQVTAITIRAKTDVTYEPLAVGAVLPFAVAGWEPYSAPDRSEASSGCHLAFICDIGCGACSALADRYATETRSDSGPSPLWLIGGDSADVASWANKHGLPRDRVLGLLAKKGPFWRPLVVGDIWFTPTRVVLTPSLVVRDARPLDALLSKEQVQDLCQNGGAAPQGLQELRDLVEAEEWSIRSIDPPPP